MADVRIKPEGSIVLFDVESDEANEWWDANVEEGMTYCGQKVVEHRYATEIGRALLDQGFDVEVV